MKTFIGTLFCIHGFLGQASDWKSVLPDSIPTVSFDLFSPVSERPSLNFESLNHWILSAAKSYPSPRVLVGYSLGGRIALNTLVSNPEAWDAAIIISAHPGLASSEDRKKRIEWDESWAKRFESVEWNKLISEWNSQPVLKESQTTPRLEHQFSRAALAESLRGCSLGMQADLRNQIKELKIPILWIVGEKDEKFLTLAKEVSGLTNISLVVISQASHRAPWDQPESFKKSVLTFLNGLKINSI